MMINMYLEQQSIYYKKLYIFNKYVSSLNNCKKNIYLAIQHFWDIEINKFLISNSAINFPFEECFNFIVNNKYANSNFTTFFFAFYKPTAKAFINKINSLTRTYLDSFITAIFCIYGDMLNLLAIELEGLDISCEVVGNNHICNDFKCKDTSNIVTLLITPEYFLERDLFNNLIDAFKLLTNKKKVVLIVDYRNLHIPYSWEREKAYIRYEKSKKYFCDIYFYRFGDNISFDGYVEESKLIHNEQEYKKIMSLLENKQRVCNG